MSSFSTFTSLYKLGRGGGVVLKSYYLHPKTCFVFYYLSHSVATYHHHGDDPDHFVCAAVRGGAERRRSSAPRVPRQKHKSLQVLHQRRHNPHSRKRLLPLSSSSSPSPPPPHPSSPSHPPPKSAPLNITLTIIPIASGDSPPSPPLSLSPPSPPLSPPSPSSPSSISSTNFQGKVLMLRPVRTQDIFLHSFISKSQNMSSISMKSL